MHDAQLMAEVTMPASSPITHTSAAHQPAISRPSGLKLVCHQSIFFSVMPLQPGVIRSSSPNRPPIRNHNFHHAPARLMASATHHAPSAARQAPIRRPFRVPGTRLSARLTAA